MSKGQEVAPRLLIYVHPLIVGKDHVVQYRKLFLDAVNWYSRILVEDLTESKKRFVSYVSDPDYSLLLDLKKKIEAGNEIPDEKMNDLLGLVVTKYHAHLVELGKEPWIREDAVKKQLDQLDQITRGDIVKNKK